MRKCSLRGFYFSFSKRHAAIILSYTAVLEYVNINEVVFTIFFFSLLTEACWIFGFPISILALAASRALTVISKDNTHEQSSKRILAQQIIEELGGQKHAICSDLRNGWQR